MKRLISIMAFVAATFPAMAASYAYLVISQLDGTEVGLPVSGLTLTFADQQLQAVSNLGTTTLNLSTLSSMRFSETDPSGISDASEQATSLRLNGRLLQVSAPAGSHVIIANVGGMLIDRFTAGSDTMTTPLRPGIYLVRINDRTTKIHVR